MKILESHQQFEKKHIFKLDEKSSRSQKTISLKEGSILHAKNYRRCNLFLIRGQAEISYRGYADKAIIGKSNISDEKGIFNIYDCGQFARCLSDCKFLVVSKVSIDKKKNISSDNATMNILDDIKTLVLDRNIKQEVLEKKYNKLKNNNKKLMRLLKGKQFELSNSKNVKKNTNYELVSSNKNKENTLSVIDEDKNSSLEPVDYLLDRNVPSFFKGMIQFIQSNMLHVASLSKRLKSVKDKKQFSKKENYKVVEHDWLRMNEAYPLKSGMYYISDGKEVAVSYFNKNKRVFHLTAELDIRYWSTKVVTLPQ